MRNLNIGATGGVSVSGVVGIVFVILKLVGVIDWSWWWVTVPFWGPLIIIALALAIVTIVMAISDKAERKRRGYY